MVQGEDGRQHRRVRLPVAVSYRTAGGFLVAYSVNLSKGGLFIEAPPLPVGTQVHVELELPGGRAVGIEGAVAWVRREAAPRLPVGMGVRFTGALDERIGGDIDRLATAFEGLEILVLAAPGERSSLLERYIQGFLDCTCITVDSRERAVAALADGVDLALVDIDTMGVEAMELIRHARAAAAPVPVLALAGDEESRSWAMRHGVDEVLFAPPSFTDLKAAVIAALTRPVLKRL